MYFDLLPGSSLSACQPAWCVKCGFYYDWASTATWNTLVRLFQSNKKKCGLASYGALNVSGTVASKHLLVLIHSYSSELCRLFGQKAVPTVACIAALHVVRF